MSETTQHFVNEMLDYVCQVSLAHTENALSELHRVRHWDNTTPYIVHPMWCAMTILCETALSEELRLNGYKTLLWHDVLEDTRMASLPDFIPPAVVEYVNAMTFNSFEEEVINVWNQAPEVRLFKLVDKVSNVMDGAWMSDDKWRRYIHFIRLLSCDVEQNFGTLNIVRIARSVAVKCAE